MDSSKKVTRSVNRKNVKKTETVFFNYVFSKPQDKQKKLGLLEENLLSRQQNETGFDINDLMGFTFQHKSRVVRYFYEICFYDDDLELFRLLTKLGLKDVCSKSIGMNTWFFCFNATRCLKEVFTKPDITQHFLIGADSPVFSAISKYNQDILETICLHPTFKEEYLNHETIHKKNPMSAAADAFNSRALEFLIQRNAPHRGDPQSNIITSFDSALNRFLDFFSGKKFINYFRRKLNLTLVNQEVEQDDLFDKRYMFAENIIKVFYLLLNNTPQHDYFYSLCLLPEMAESCHDLFDLLNSVVTDLKIQKAPMKLLLDILLSTGQGLFFKELPARLQSFYNDDMPNNVEIVLPVLQSDNKTFKYFYFFEDFKVYLRSNLSSFKIADGMMEFLLCKQMKMQSERADCSFIEELMTIIYGNANVQQNFRRKTTAITIEESQKEEKNVIEQMKDILNSSLPENINLLFLAMQSQELESIETQLVDPQKFAQMDPSERIFEEIVLDNEKFLKSLYTKWIILDKIFCQGIPSNETRVLRYLRETQEQFLRSLKKIDYYSMISLYAYSNMRHLLVSDQIELLKVSLSLIKSIKHKYILKNSAGDYKSFLRLEFVLHAFLIGSYQQNNQPKLAKKELEQCILIMRVEHCGKLFHRAYNSKIHQMLVHQAFEYVTKALIHIEKPRELIYWLDQIKEYQLRALFPNSNNTNIQSLENYIIKVIDNELFYEARHLIELFPGEKSFLLGYQNSRIDKALKLLESNIYILSLENYISINIEQRKLEIDYEKIGVFCLRIKKEMPVELCFEQPKIIAEQVHLLSENQLMNIFKWVQNILQIEASTKPTQQNYSTSTSTSIVEEQLIPSMNYLCLYGHTNQIKRQKPKKGKITKTDNNEEEHSEENVSIKKVNQKNIDIDRDKLKHLAELDDSYTDLIMIKNHCSSRSKRFLAIKNLPQFQSFLSVCYIDTQNQNQLSVDSVNPYGENEHGVKWCDVKNGSEKTYKIKVKANGSERMIGAGKEVYDEQRKFIVYQADEVVSHKQGEKLFRY